MRPERERAFSDSLWPCPPELRDAYAARCAVGHERIASASVVWCGLARELGDEVEAALARIEASVAAFADHRIFLYENDSKDATPERLRAWADANPRVRVVCEQLDRPRWPSIRSMERTAQMAEYRERVQREILPWITGPDAADYVIVADPDLHGWSDDGIAHSFGHSDWDAMASNGLSHERGRPNFYDGWAFRTHSHPDAFPGGSLVDMLHPRGAPLVPVLSAFGGLAIYRAEAFRAGKYAGGDCEHVQFHKSLIQAGYGRLFMNPSQFTLYPDREWLSPRV